MRLEATAAMQFGNGYVAQCPECGVLIYVPSRKMILELGPCPSCARNARWTHVDVPVGPFRNESA